MKIPKFRIGFKNQLVVWSLLFILPSFLILGIFRLTPIFMSARLSFFNANLLSKREVFIGFQNYAEAFTDQPLLNAFKQTLVFVLLKTPLQIIISLGLAMLINRRLLAIGLFRSAPLMAVVMPMSIAAVLWRMMYHPSNGIFNSLLATLGLPPQGFLVNVHQAMASLVALAIWKDAGFYMIIYLAGLQGIPEEYYDAAKVDGASPWGEFRHITLPLLRRTTALVLILTTVFSFNVFIPVYIMTQGGPASATEVIVYYMYKMAFQFYRMGYANAIAIITLIIVLVISALQLRILRVES
jgi:ABC-type sugar transport system permease subunit